MNGPTFMVHAQLGRSNAALFEVAGNLVESFDAHAVGIAACQPMQIAYGDGYAYAAGDLIQQDRQEIDGEIVAAERTFRQVIGNRAQSVSFRSTITYSPLADYIASEARCADLMITGVDHSGSLLNNTRHVDMGELLMGLGRPALLVPDTVESLILNQALVAWKDTAETRRAVLAALPFLKKTAHVSVVEIAPENDREAAQLRVQDVADWLHRHGVNAQGATRSSAHDDAIRLAGVARELDADYVVAGVYGHSRMREWMLGGVTRDFLLKSDRSLLVCH
jgi:nucleotide-binding universal stress UspA family protein